MYIEKTCIYSFLMYIECCMDNVYKRSHDEHIVSPLPRLSHSIVLRLDCTIGRLDICNTIYDSLCLVEKW